MINSLSLCQLNRSRVDQNSEGESRDFLYGCCHSRFWVEAMLAARPFASKTEVLDTAEKIWQRAKESDYREAFAGHAKIGDIDALKKKYSIANREQGQVAEASTGLIAALAKGNEDYLAKHGFIFIICAMGKSAQQMLDLLNQRLANDTNTELNLAAREQAKITALRLQQGLEE